MSVIHNSLARAHSKALVGPPGAGARCLMERASNWWAANNRHTEGRLKVPAWKVPCSMSRRTTTLIVSWGVLSTQFQEGLAGLRTEGFARALVFAGLAVQRGKSLVAQKVIPALQCGSRIGLAAPGPFAGQSGGSGQREVLL